MAKHLPEEIEEAVNILQEAERQNNLKEKIREFEQGLEILDLYLKENNQINTDLKIKINNYKKSYTRALLTQLPSAVDVDFGTWFDYIKIMSFLINDEITEVEIENPRLKENRENFVNLYRNKMIELISNSCK